MRQRSPAATRPTLAVVRRAERNRFPEKLGDEHPGFFFECLDFPALERSMSAYYVEFEPVPSRVHHHAGAEFLYIIDGHLVVTVGDTAYELGPGDSMYFDPSVPHKYQRSGAATCRAVVVTA